MTFRDSGLQWIGRIPTSWRVVPTRSVLRIAKEEVGEAWVSTPLLSLTKQGVVLRDIDSGEGKMPESFDSYQVLEPDDLVFCLFDMDETPRTVGRAVQRGMITGAYTRFVVDHLVADPRFLEWYFISIDDGKRFRPLYTGLRKVIQKPRFLAAGLTLPPLIEQRAIADYLDRETARIDTLIEEQQRLIEMLRARRNSVIDRSVFGLGVTGSTPKATIGRHLAVEPLLGSIPDGWQVKRLKVVLARVEERNVDLTQPMMSLKVTGELVPRGASQQLPDEASLPRYHVARVGDLVVNPMWLTGGAVGVAEVDGAVSPDYRVFRPTGSHHPRYLHHLMRSSPYRDQYVLYTRANTTFDRRVQQPDLDNLPLPVPPIVEQEKIAAEIDRQTVRIDALISETERFIELARERRAALITAAVTGQIDVRKMA